jgi:hypothetical protein
VLEICVSGDGGIMLAQFEFYKQQGQISDPGAYLSFLNNLPGDVPGLVQVVQGLTLHIFWAENYGFQPTPARQAEVNLRWIEKRLQATLELNPFPLTQVRPVDKRLLGNCRDFSTLLAALLKHKGIPARARCGFATYFIPNHFEDHWVVEYWNFDQCRWILVDAQMDNLQREHLHLPFDPLDVPRDQFIVGGRAWQMVRQEGYDPNQFGIFDMVGLGFIRGNLIRDVASLNKMEMLPWDCWGLILADKLDDPTDLELLDQLALLTCWDVPEWEQVVSLYKNDPRLKIGGSITSFIQGVPTEIEMDRH